jgi:CO/xanthine dehydrogenase FAD-binding subunit
VDVVRATSVDEVVNALADRPDATLLAGGTDLMVEVNARSADPRSVVTLRRVEELREWDGRRIGAGVTYEQMERGRVVALAEAARTVGSPQIRSVGTLGGNLGTASPAGDTLPVLAALDAVVELRAPTGTRTVGWDQFITGVKRTDLQSGELITAVLLPEEMPERQAFAKVGVRSAMVISIVSACAVRWADGRVAVAMGAVAPTPVRMARAEEVVAGPARPTEAALAEFERRVRDDVSPISDQRGTAEYRRHAAGVLARRVLERVSA